ncbi:MAG TPA: SgcJ/EcaC family oxidoreductase [Candidatus Acidoferrales bacterium]|nr:SgcJ/EcaC family oxidoreductase [Candidatus Acidoferrales bacterium]
MSRARALSLMIAAVFTACFAAACAQPQPAAPPDTRAADEAAVRATDAEWSKTAATKDVEKTISYYTDDAILLAPGAPPVVGRDELRKAWQRMLAAPGLHLTTAPISVEVARSGELAWEVGSFQVKTLDHAGKASTQSGKFVLVWKKQGDGSWKVAADTNGNDR